MADKNKLLLYSLVICSVFVILNFISIIIPFFTQISYLESYRIVFGSIFVLFLPGFVISFIFFQKTKKENNKHNQEDSEGIDIIERIALSFALSISVVPLAVFYLNLVGVKINSLNVFFTILTIIIISLLILFIKDYKNFKNKVK